MEIQTSVASRDSARGGEHEGRHRVDEEVLVAHEELRQPVVGVGGTEEEQGPCIIRPHCAAAGRRLWRRRSTAGPWEVRLVNLARQSSSSLSCGKRFLSR